MAAPVVMIAKDAYEPWAHLFEAANLPVRYVLVDSKEEVLLDGEKIHPKEVPANAIWMSIETLRGIFRKTFLHVFENAPDLKLVHSIGAGFDMPITQNLMKRGVTLTTSHVNSISIAEFVMRAILERTQRADLAREARDRKEYPRDDIREIYKQNWLIYGMGTIGSRIAERAQGFGVNVTGVRRSPTGKEPVNTMIKPAEVNQDLGKYDVVVFSMPSNADTQQIGNAEFFAKMKKGSIFVNVGRAALVDEDALLAALDSGHLDYAILDVHTVEEAWLYRGERMDDSPLWTHPKILLTPHGAAHGDGRHERNAQLFIDNLRRFLNDEELPDKGYIIAE
jgi:phosphoglycerate dehydrogenase-like enzyme